MNMKKLMAGVVAGALAVTTLAATAFADKVSLTKDGAKTYHAEVVVTKPGNLATLGDFTAAGFTATAEGINVDSVSVSMDLVCGTAVKNKTKDAKVEKNVVSDVKFTTTDSKASISYDFAGVETGAEYKLTYTIAISSAKEIKAADNFELATGVAGKCTVKDATTGDPAPMSSFTIGIEGSESDFTITRQQARDLSANGGTITFSSYIYGATAKELEDANVLPTILKATVKTNYETDGVTQSLVLNAEGQIVVNIPKGYATHVGDEVTDYAKITVSVTPFSGWTDATSSKSAGWGFYGAELAFDNTNTQQPATSTSDTSDTQVSEDDPTNTSASDTQAPASSDDNGNTNAGTGDDKNQPTGVALAVIPAIVAAAGVVIAKKRG